MTIYTYQYAYQTDSHKKRRTIFSLQIFLSDSELLSSYSEPESLLVSKALELGEDVELKIYIPQSSKFIRVDPGRYFSIHKNPQFDVILIKGKEEGETVSCNPGVSSVYTSQINWEYASNASFMICGLDAQYAFKNPFPHSDICVRFTSQFVIGVSE